MGDIVGDIRRGRPATGCLFRRGGVWWLEQREAGKRSRRSLGTPDRRRAELIRWQLLVGEVAPVIAAVKPHLPLADALNVVATEALAAGTSAEVVASLRLRWGRLVRTAAARGVTGLIGLAGVARAIIHEDLGDLAAKTRREYGSIMRRVCRAHGVADPLAGVIIRGPSGQRRALTDEEVQRVLASTQGELRQLLILGLYTGVRLGDLCCLTWGNVESDLIRFTPNKTAKSSGRVVVVPVHPDLAAALPPRGLPPAPVLPETAKQYERCRRTPSIIVSRSFARLGIHAGFHHLRHTFISRLASAGVGENLIMAMAGHSNTITSRRYQHIDPATLTGAVCAAFTLSRQQPKKETDHEEESRIECPR